MHKLFVTIVCFLLLVTPFTLAQLAVEPGTKSQTLCQRETGLFTYTIKNLDDVTRTFTVSRQGSAAGWTSTVPNGFTLLAGAAKTVYTYVTPLQSVSPGDYDLQLVIASDDAIKTVSETIAVQDCYSGEIGSSTTSQMVCPEGVAQYDFTLVNTGNFLETYHLVPVGPLADQTTLSEPVKTLAAGERVTIKVFVRAPKESRGYTVTVQATGEKSKKTDSYTVDLRVGSCYDFLVEVLAESDTYNFCEHTQVTVPITITNTGTTTNTFVIATTGPSWSQFDRYTLTLVGGAKGTIDLILAPDFGISGDFSIPLSVIPQYGEQKAMTTLQVKVNQCHGVAVDLIGDETKLCNGMSSEFVAQVTNTGTDKKEYNLNIEKPGWVGFYGEKNLTLAPGANRMLRFIATPGNDVAAGTYILHVLARATDASRVTAVAEDTLAITTVPVRECYLPTLTVPVTDLTVYEDSSLTVPLTLTNTGITKAHYNLILTGSASSFAQLSPSAITIDSGKSDIIFLYLAPTPELALGDYTAQVSVRLVDSTFLTQQDLAIEVTDDASRQTIIPEIVQETVQQANKATGAFWRTLLGFSAQDTEVPRSNVASSREVSPTGMLLRVKTWMYTWRYLLLGVLALLLLLLILWRVGVFGRLRKLFSGGKDDDVAELEKLLE